jgi:hAT family C-terminal dimerisation region
MDCVELVTANGCPLSLFDAPAMKRILKRGEVKGAKSKQPNSKNVREEVLITSKKQESDLKNLLKNQLISLKIDFATCQGRSFLGVTMQSYIQKQIYHRLLVCKEVNESHTGPNVKDQLKEILNFYNIELNQVISITKDTASNLKKATKLLRIDIEMMENAEDADDAINTLDERSIHFQEDDVISEQDLSQNDDDFYFVDVDCVVHVIQLGINKFLNNTNGVSKTIAIAQKAAVKLRNPTLRTLLRLANKKQAILMHAVRWSWTFRLLTRLSELKEFCKDNEDTFPALKIVDAQWEKIAALRDVLEPMAILTSQLQDQNLSIPSFTFLFKKAEIKLQCMNSQLSKALLLHLKPRKSQIFNTDLMSAGIFLDKRFSVMLKEQQVNDAKNFISLVFQKIEKKPQQSLEVDKSPERSGIQDREVSMLNELMSSIEATHYVNNTDPTIYQDLNDEIQRYINIPRLQVTENASEDVMTFWNENAPSFPNLSKIAFAIFSIPLTEVDVERLFSNLNFILDSHRTSLDSEIVNAMMLIRMNKKFE